MLIMLSNENNGNDWTWKNNTILVVIKFENNQWSLIQFDVTVKNKIVV